MGGDCVAQVQGEPGGGLVAERGMRPRSVVVDDPGRGQLVGVGEVPEQGLVQDLVAHPAVEALDEAVLHGLVRRDVVPFDPVLGAPLQDRVRGELCPVVRNDHPGPVATFNQRGQFPRHAAARDRRVRDGCETFLGDVIDDVQQPEPPPAGELVVNEVKRPSGVGPRLDQIGARVPIALRRALRLWTVNPSSR